MPQARRVGEVFPRSWRADVEGEGIGLACLPPSAGRRKRKAEKGGEKERFISFAFFWELSLKHSGLLLKKKKKRD